MLGPVTAKILCSGGKRACIPHIIKEDIVNSMWTLLITFEGGLLHGMQQVINVNQS